MGRAARKWARRKLKSVGSHFRIEAGSPKNGINGPESAKLYFTNDEGEVFLITQDHGLGLARIDSDKSIEVRAGDKNNPNQIDIRVSAATGDITINADRGRVRVHAKDISMSADEDVDIKAGRNINLKAGSGRIFMKAPTATVQAKRGNMTPKTWGQKVFENSFVPDDVLDGMFSGKAQVPQDGAKPGGFDGVAAAALTGSSFTLEDLGLSESLGGIDSVLAAEDAAIDALGGIDAILNDPLGSAAGLLGDDAANQLSQLQDTAAGIQGAVDNVQGILNDPLGSAGQALGVDIDNLSVAGVDIGPAGRLISEGGTSALLGDASSLLGGGSLSTLDGINSIFNSQGASALSAAAASIFGLGEGSKNADTGIVGKVLATGPLGKGAAATVSPNSGDSLAALDSAASDLTPIPETNQAETAANTDTQAEAAADIAQAQRDAEIDAEFGTSDEARRLLSGETVDGVTVDFG